MDNTNPPNNQNPTSQPNPVPSIPESEMKLPEEQFSEPTPVTVSEKKSLMAPILLILLVIMLAALTAVVVWGEEIVNMFLPPVNNEAFIPENMGTEEEPTTEEELNDMEAELESVDFSDMEAELEAIETEIEAESTATTTTH